MALTSLALTSLHKSLAISAFSTLFFLFFNLLIFIKSLMYSVHYPFRIKKYLPWDICLFCISLLHIHHWSIPIDFSTLGKGFEMKKEFQKIKWYDSVGLFPPEVLPRIFVGLFSIWSVLSGLVGFFYGPFLVSAAFSYFHPFQLNMFSKLVNQLKSSPRQGITNQEWKAY